MGASVFSQPQLNELSITALRGGEELVVSAWVHNPAEGPAFRIADLLAAAEPQRDVLRPLRHALGEAPAEVQAGMWGVTLPSTEGYPPAGFTMSLILGPAPSSGDPESEDPLDPDSAKWEGAEVTDCVLDGHPGQRRVRRMQSPRLATGTSVPLLAVVYVAGTPHGVLTVGFGTPHVDFAEIFSALFDRIAHGVRIVSAGAVSA